MKAVLLVGNPTAQSGKNQERIERAARLLEKRGFRVELLATRPNGLTTADVRERLAHEPFEIVVYMGGDGTFREVAAGLYESSKVGSVPLGMLPTGTANDQGRSFGSRPAKRRSKTMSTSSRVGI